MCLQASVYLSTISVLCVVHLPHQGAGITAAWGRDCVTSERDQCDLWLSGKYVERRLSGDLLVGVRAAQIISHIQCFIAIT